MGSVLGAEHILLMALSRCTIQNISNTFLSVDGFAIPFCCVLSMQEAWVSSLSQEDPLRKDIATHSNILVWEIPRTEEPGGL